MSTKSIGLCNIIFLFLFKLQSVGLYLDVITMTLALPGNRVAFYQCGFCSASLQVDCRNCRNSRDSRGNFSDCVLDEVAWYKGSFSIGKHGKPCCTSCMAGWPSWTTNQAHKVAFFWKHSHQICDDCVVTLEIAGAPAIAVAAGAPVGAIAADAPGVAAPAAAPTPHQPPPPRQPPINHAMQQLRIMETKVAVLEAQVGEIQLVSAVMSQKFEETMVKLQLDMEAKMEAQEQRMSVRMDTCDDTVAVLEAQVEMMSKTIEELQLALEEKRDRQENCEDAYEMPHEEIGVQWHKVKSSSPHDEERLPHDSGRMMSNGMMMQ